MSKGDIARRKFNPDLSVDENLASLERIHRRRAVFTDAPLNCSLDSNADSSASKTMERLVAIPDSDKVFKYSCSGLMGGKSDLTGKHIEWKATFDRPLEHLIYPSLQRFEVYEGRSKANKRYPGMGDNHSSALHTQALEPIVGDKLSVHEDAMFLFTPKWTMSIKEVDKHSDEAANSSSADAIDIEGERYLRAQTKERASKLSELKHSKDSASGASRRRREGMVSTALTSALHSSSQLYESLVRQSSQSRSKTSADTEQLPSASSNAISRDAAFLDTAARNLLGDHEHGGFTSEQEVFNKHRRALAQVVPPSQKHLMDGLLFYRYQNENRKAEIAHDREINEVLMRTQGVRIAHRGSTDSFSMRFARRKKAQMELNLKREEVERLRQSNKLIEDLHETADHAMPLAEQRINEKYSIDKLTRLQRAMSGINGSLPRPRNKGNRTGASKGAEMHPSGSRSVSSRRALSPEGGTDDSSRRRLGFTLSPSDQHPNDDSQGAGASYQKLFSETSVRHAQDLLLLSQIDKGVLPELFIKQSSSSDDPSHVSVVLSKYGIGDTRGLCLGLCLQSLPHLDSLGLSDNRLTSVSLPSIIDHLSFKSLMALDLSCNAMHGAGVAALASFFSNKTVLEDVDLSSCGITCPDITVLFSILKVYPNRLEDIRLASNLIGEQGVHSICSYLISEHCRLVELDLSWNSVREAGAGYFAHVAIPYNKTLKVLNLSSNAIGDSGGQFLMHSLRFNSKLTHLTLSQNEIADYTCFVASKVLKKHPSLLRLDLSFNCLGEAGSRSLFRNVLRGMGCWVIMENCTFFDRAHMYNHSFPSNDNPYTLDLSEPYKAAVLHELLVKYAEDPTNCSFEGLSYREDVLKGPEQTITLSVNSKREVCLKATGEVWIPPDKGLVRFSFQQAVSVPSAEHAIKAGALDMLMRIVEAGREADRKKDVDRKRQWLTLLSQDTFFTTRQVQQMIDRFHRNNTIGDGELTKADVLKSVWNYVVDTENKFDFLYANTNEAQRRDVIYALTLKRYKFNWSNPTANWKLNLEDKAQRTLMFQLVAINHIESDFSKNASNRGDTSQNGNWFNFRNAKYTVHKETRDIVIDKDFVKSIPSIGSIEFDFVSTTRPSGVAIEAELSNPPDDTSSAATTSSTTIAGGGTSSSVRVVTEDQFFRFLDMLKLSSRKKVSAAGALFVLLDLQLASTKHYFTVDHIHLLLETFEDEWQVQSRVVVCMFSRIVDLHRIDVLLRSLDRKAQHEIMHRLGYLNVINPLKISFDYSLCLKHLDNRIVLISLMELAAIESADQVIEESNTELPIQTIYGAYTRTLNESRPETMRFHYADFGKRTRNVSWSSRRDLLRKFLVGTQPMDDKLLLVINQYKELEAAGRLTEGPIDLQYNSFQKDSKSSAAKAKANTKAMIETMRSNAAAAAAALRK